MKVFIVAAISVDGFIARNTAELADWTGKEDKKVFVELTKRAGVVVMGRTTFETIGRPLPGRRNIIFTTHRIDQEGVEATQLAPPDLIASLEADGYTEVAICGGRSVYDQFLQAKVVDELYLTLIPTLFGDGISLFKSPISQALRLKSEKKLSDGVLFLHYEVIK